MYLSIHTVVGLEQQPLLSSYETEPVPKVDVEIEPKEQIVSIIEATYDENNSILSKNYNGQCCKLLLFYLQKNRLL